MPLGASCCSRVIYAQQLLTQRQHPSIICELEHVLAISARKMRVKLVLEQRTLDKFRVYTLKAKISVRSAKLCYIVIYRK